MLCRWRPGLILLSLLLGACAVTPELDQEPVSPEGFALVGRMGVRSGEQGFSGGLRWVHDAQKDRLTLSSPLGQVMAEIEAGREGATLILPDRRLIAGDLEELMQREMGWVLPLRGLPDWVQGRPHPGSAYRAKYNDARQVESLWQDGWRIEYQRYSEAPGAKARPLRVVLIQGEIELRLVVDRWAQEVPP